MLRGNQWQDERTTGLLMNTQNGVVMGRTIFACGGSVPRLVQMLFRTKYIAVEENSRREISLVTFISHKRQYFGSETYIRRLGA